jgi:hypothetical protein
MERAVSIPYRHGRECVGSQKIPGTTNSEAPPRSYHGVYYDVYSDVYDDKP